VQVDVRRTPRPDDSGPPPGSTAALRVALSTLDALVPGAVIASLEPMADGTVEVLLHLGGDALAALGASWSAWEFHDETCEQREIAWEGRGVILRSYECRAWQWQPGGAQ